MIKASLESLDAHFENMGNQIATQNQENNSRTDNLRPVLPTDTSKINFKDLITNEKKLNRKSLLKVMEETLNTLQSDKENAYTLASSLLSTSPYDPFVQANVAKFLDSVNKTSSEIVKIVKIVSDLCLQWEVLDESGGDEDGFVGGSGDDDPLFNASDLDR